MTFSSTMKAARGELGDTLSYDWSALRFTFRVPFLLSSSVRMSLISSIDWLVINPMQFSTLAKILKIASRLL
jgi:hypothetical protein